MIIENRTDKIINNSIDENKSDDLNIKDNIARKYYII